MLKIGITGGIGSGKSLISNAFSLLNIPIYNADSRAKALINHNSTIRNKIINLLGVNSYLENGEYNRGYVAEVVFKNPELLKELNAIVHPAVKEDSRVWFDENKNAVYVLYEAAIMSSAQNSNELDYVVVVHTNKSTRIDRILKRDSHRTMTDVEVIMANQKSEDEFLEIADFTIKNNEGDLVLEQVLKLHQKFLTS